MQATVSFLAKIIETGLFLELIENKEETPDIRSFVTVTMANALDEISAEGIYQSAYEVFAKKKRDSYVQVRFGDLHIKILHAPVSLHSHIPNCFLASIRFWTCWSNL